MFTKNSDKDTEILMDFIERNSHQDFIGFLLTYTNMKDKKFNSVMGALGYAKKTADFYASTSADQLKQNIENLKSVKVNDLFAEAMVIQKALYLKYFEIYDAVDKEVLKKKEDPSNNKQHNNNANSGLGWMNVQLKKLSQQPYYPRPEFIPVPNIRLPQAVIVDKVYYIASYSEMIIPEVSTHFQISTEQAEDLVKYALACAINSPLNDGNGFRLRIINRLNSGLVAHKLRGNKPDEFEARREQLRKMCSSNSSPEDEIANHNDCHHKPVSICASCDNQDCSTCTRSTSSSNSIPPVDPDN